MSFLKSIVIYLIHSMKEQLRLFWNHTDEKKAGHFLAIWCRDVWESGIQQLVDIAKTPALYRSGLLTYFKHRITSGSVEGLVNKIKTLKKQAYGFRDMDILNSGYVISILRGTR